MSGAGGEVPGPVLVVSAGMGVLMFVLLAIAIVLNRRNR